MGWWGWFKRSQTKPFCCFISIKKIAFYLGIKSNKSNQSKKWQRIIERQWDNASLLPGNLGVYFFFFGLLFFFFFPIINSLSMQSHSGVLGVKTLLYKFCGATVQPIKHTNNPLFGRGRCSDRCLKLSWASFDPEKMWVRSGSRRVSSSEAE